MADSNTTTYSFTLPEVGASADSWGTKLNANWDKVDDLLDGSIAVNGITVTGGSIDGTPVGATTPSTGEFTTVTTTGNVDVTGTVTADGLTVDGVARVDGDITIGRTTGSYVFTETDGGSERAGIHSSSLNDLVFKVNNQIPAIKIDGGTRDVSFYEDTGTTAKMVWDASAESLAIGTTADTGRVFHVKQSGNYPCARFEGKTGGYSAIEFSSHDNDGTVGAMVAWNGKVYMGHRNTAEDGVDQSKAVTIDSSGNVGIGTAIPSGKIDIVGAGGQDTVALSKPSNGFPSIKFTGASSSTYLEGGDDFRIYTGATPSERMRIDSSGNVGIGAPANTNWHPSWFDAVQIGNTGSTISASRTTYSSNNYLFLANNSYIDSSGNEKYARSSYALQATLGNSEFRWNQAPIGTAGDNITWKRSMTLDVGGNLLVGTTDSTQWNNTTGKGFVINGSSGEVQIAKQSVSSIDPVLIVNRTGSTSGNILDFRYAGSFKGGVTIDSTSVSYNTSSDERLKENIKDTTHTVDINDIQVREFDWKVDGSHQRYGFIAQELETVYPEAVHSPEDADEMKSVDYSKLVPLLVKEIQTLKARIETLENK